MSTAHTPGPWRQAEGSGAWWEVTAANPSKKGFPTLRIASDVQKGADAALIAAAPEMLEALQTIAAQLDQTWDAPHRPHRNAAKAVVRAAIAKATGGGK